MSPIPQGRVKKDHTIWTGALMMAVEQLEYRVLMERQLVRLHFPILLPVLRK